MSTMAGPVQHEGPPNTEFSGEPAAVPSLVRPTRDRTRCEPDCRFTDHPMRSSAASTRSARVLGQLVTRR
jgi:hypothetical protein